MRKDVPADQGLDVLTLERCLDERAVNGHAVAENETRGILVAGDVRRGRSVDVGDANGL